MKQKIILFIAVFLFNFISSSASAINLETIDSPISAGSCTEANIDRIYYLNNGENSLSKFIGDELSSSAEVLISSNSTDVKIWTSDSNLLSNCDTASDWSRISGYAPGDNETVVALGSNCTFHKPTDASKRTLQFIYNVGYFDLTATGSYNGPLTYYNTVTDIRNQSPKVKNVTNLGWTNLQKHANECFNVEIKYCGDGERADYYDTVTATQVTEVCDPTDAGQAGWGNGGCTSTCTAITLSPSISIDKTDNNPSDKDGGLTDTQLINYNTDAVFQITVQNNGDEDLRDVRISDPKATACSMTNEQTLPLIQAKGNLDSIFNIGESFTYTCSKANVVVDDINMATVYGIGVTSTDEVNDQDTSPFLIDPATIPALVSIDKVDANIDDLDTDIGGNDKQTILAGSGAVFKITLTNTGNDNLINIVVTDVLTPSCNISLASLPIGDIYTYTCTQANVTSNFFNTATVNAVGELSGDTPSDTDITEVIVGTSGNLPLCTNLTSTPLIGVAPFTSNFSCTGNNTSIFDIKVLNSSNLELYSSKTQTGSFNFENTGVYNVGCFIENQTTTTPACINTVVATVDAPTINIDKVDSNPADTDGGIIDTQSILLGGTAVFNITVTNLGNEDLNTVSVTDALSATCDRIFDLNVEGNGNGVFDIGESITYQCSDANVSVGYTNSATTNAISVTTLTPVTDTDTSLVVLPVPVVASCDSLSLTQASGTSPYSSTFSCDGTLANSYSVLLTDPNGGIQTFPTQSGVFNINIQGTYNASCFINDLSTTQPVCMKTLTYSSGGGGGGGGTAPRCNEAQFDTNTVSCDGNSKITSFEFICENGITLNKNAISGDATFILADCNASVDTSVGETLATKMNWNGAECLAYRNTTQAPSRKNCQYSPGDDGGGGGGGGPYCGDGAVQTYLGEECDGTVGCYPAGSANECTLERTTFPNNVDIQIYGPSDSYIIGNDMDLYETHANTISKPFIKNNSPIGSNSDYVIDELCVHRKSGISINDDIYCSDVGVIYPQEIIIFDIDQAITYTGDTSGITGTKDTNVIETTIRQNLELYSGAFFAKNFDVTVLKPTITTTGGGTSYVKDTSSLSNLSDISTNLIGNGVNVPENKNFVGASIGDLSSYSKGISTIDSNVVDESNALNDSVTDNISSANAETIFHSYNGIDNVSIIENSYTINDFSSQFVNDGVSKTYIIDGGNLYISDDISYSGNIAFIVKGGNIIISDSVKNITGTYIAIPKGDGSKGEIKGVNNTQNVLQIKGSIYGKLDDLLSKRTYIKNNTNGLIDVGTIVSFGSSVFRKPAPLTASFIAEYIESEKVAQ